MSKFKQLGLSESILEVLESIGFEIPTPIQEKSIPLLLENDQADFIGLAQTGTGKTAAFGLPLLDLIDQSSKKTQALIMAPTRELGQQIAQQLVEYSKNNRKIKIEVVYGGSSISNQIRALKKGVQIVVATPGRLLDLIRRKAIYLDTVDYVVLDEADEMLNMGFKEDIDSILEHTGNDRSIWLFSATMPSAIRRIVKKYMETPLEVVVNTKEISNKDITHQYVVTRVANKFNGLRRILDMQPNMRGVLFCRTKRETEQIADDLNKLGYNVAALNGDMSQGQREKVMKRFKTRTMQLLIATDVAARGIDVKNLSHVLHHRLPDQIEYYTHRSGRTGRAGNKGISLVFINPRENRRIREIENRLKVTFEQIEIPSKKEVLTSRLNQWAERIIQTEIHDQASLVLDNLPKEFMRLTKENLVKKLLSKQLDQLLDKGDSSGDLNEQMGGRRESGKSEGRPSRGGSDGVRYFINVGKIDGYSKKDLVEFLSEVSGINHKYFDSISLQNNCTYFNVAKNHDKGLSNKFRGVLLEERAIRVNRDMEKNFDSGDKKKSRRRKDGRSFSKSKNKRKGKKGKRRG